MTKTPPAPETPDLPPRHSTKSALRFDWMDWLPYLEDSNIPDDQKRQWIETLWCIVIGFVDLGWDVKSTPKTCGEAFDLKTALELAVLHSEHDTSNTDDQRPEAEDAA